MADILMEPSTNVLVDASDRSSPSAVSWTAIIAGAVSAMAVTALLTAIGAAIGFATIKPSQMSADGMDGAAIAAAVWLLVTLVAAFTAGGYVAGRLRVRFSGQDDETAFRDSIHGVLAWAAAVVFGGLLAASGIAAGALTGIQATATVASGALSGAGAAADETDAASNALIDYATAYVLRIDGPPASAPPTYAPTTDPVTGTSTTPVYTQPAPRVVTPASADMKADVAVILANGLRTGDVPDGDRTYLASIVAQRSGVSDAEARSRVDSAIERLKADAAAAERQAKEAADAAARAAAYLAAWTFTALALGALAAGIAARSGGRDRDLI